MAGKLTRHQILLYAGDMERLRAIYHTLTPTAVIRDLVRGHCDRVEAKLLENKDGHHSGTVRERSIEVPGG
jgi:hypothetical protein